MVSAVIGLEMFVPMPIGMMMAPEDLGAVQGGNADQRSKDKTEASREDINVSKALESNHVALKIQNSEESGEKDAHLFKKIPR